MKWETSFEKRVSGALFGMFIGDALAMPVHWYYNTDALWRDYGEVREYLDPKNPHPDSILWRSSYNPVNASADILHDQAKYWGRKGIHYHQFLQAGENTLNLKLAGELWQHLQEGNGYSAESWLQRFIAYLTNAGNHRDTYLEEYLRHFFTNYGRGIPPERCGRQDEHHIGGLSLMLPLLIFYSDQPERAKVTGLEHLALTHGGPLMARGGTLAADLLLAVIGGSSLQEEIETFWKQYSAPISNRPLVELVGFPDEAVVGKHFSSACYMEQALPATLYLAAKYHNRPEDGLVANTMCGGDNCGRGALLGALLGAAAGIDGWPRRWLDGLLDPPFVKTP